jgi:hypothetical protein
LLVTFALLFFAAEGFSGDEEHETGVIPLPQGNLFQPLISDPKQPRFAMSILHASLPGRDTTGGIVSFGENFGIVRWPRSTPEDGVQLNLSGAVFAQFDLEAPSSDLINADYVIGFPFTYRGDYLSGRFRIYHQSSHLGDEFLLRVQPERVNLSFESGELLLSFEWNVIRVYGGGEYLFRREPSSLKPGLLHGGFEYRHRSPLIRVPGLGSGHLVGALDVKSWQEDDWEPAWSIKTGLDFSPAETGPRAGRHWSLLLQGYNGFTPYGQFFTEDVSYLGFGIQLSL